jgi:peptidoglycan hydrolase-like protein with peptidoglycan-binding domain
MSGATPTPPAPSSSQSAAVKATPAAAASTAGKPTLAEDHLSIAQWKVIQRSLEEQGFDPGDVDGHPGDKTRQAIRAFQAQAGVPQTGHLLPEQIAQLMQGR